MRQPSCCQLALTSESLLAAWGTLDRYAAFLPARSPGRCLRGGGEREVERCGEAIDSAAVGEAKASFRKVHPFQLCPTPISLPEVSADVCVQLVAHLGLTFDAIDFLATEDRGLVFLEINPNA
jgi:hypothetical protein